MPAATTITNNNNNTASPTTHTTTHTLDNWLETVNSIITKYPGLATIPKEADYSHIACRLCHRDKIPATSKAFESHMNAEKHAATAKQWVKNNVAIPNELRIADLTDICELVQKFGPFFDIHDRKQSSKVICTICGDATSSSSLHTAAASHGNAFKGKPKQGKNGGAMSVRDVALHVVDKSEHVRKVAGIALNILKILMSERNRSSALSHPIVIRDTYPYLCCTICAEKADNGGGNTFSVFHVNDAHAHFMGKEHREALRQCVASNSPAASSPNPLTKEENILLTDLNKYPFLKKDDRAEGMLFCRVCRMGSIAPGEDCRKHVISEAHCGAVEKNKKEKKKQDVLWVRGVMMEGRLVGGVGQKFDQDGDGPRHLLKLEAYSVPPEMTDLHIVAFPLYDEVKSSTRDLRRIVLQRVDDLFPPGAQESKQRKVPPHTTLTPAQMRSICTVHLHAEETARAINLSAFNLSSTTIDPVEEEGWDEKNLYEFCVPGVGEKRPSLLINDKAHVREIPPEDAISGSLANAKVYTGYVHLVKDNSIDVSMPETFKKKAGGFIYTVEFELSRTIFRRQHRAVNRLPDEAMLLRSSCSEKLAPDSPAVCVGRKALPFIPKAIERLNALQRKALEHMMGPAKLTVLWGPPGTGKTHVLVAAILRIALAGGKALVCCAGNEAADLICKILLEAVENDGHLRRELRKREESEKGKLVIRLNGASRDPKVVHITVRESCCTPLKASGRRFEAPRHCDLLGHSTVVSTIAGADMLPEMEFDRGSFTHLIVDEAGYASIPCLMQALHAGNGQQTKVILAGDHKQLGPMLSCPALEEVGLGSSYFHAICTDDGITDYSGESLVKQLNVSYRCHPAILSLVNAFYGDSLESSPELAATFGSPGASFTTVFKRNYMQALADVSRQVLAREDPSRPAPTQSMVLHKLKKACQDSGKALVKPPSAPIVFVDHTHHETQSACSVSYENEFEANVVVHIVLSLLNAAAEAPAGAEAAKVDIAVITFYSDQKARITDKLVKALTSANRKSHYANYVYDCCPETGVRLSKPLLRGTFIRVATVDAFQGQEAKTVIISFVRSPKTPEQLGSSASALQDNTNTATDAEATNAHTIMGDDRTHSAIGFVGQPERLNVAVSRAKEMVFFVGNLSHLESCSPLCQQYAARIRECGGAILSVKNEAIGLASTLNHKATPYKPSLWANIVRNNSK